MSLDTPQDEENLRIYIYISFFNMLIVFFLLRRFSSNLRLCIYIYMFFKSVFPLLRLSS